MRSIRGRSDSARRGVNAAATSRRSRACSGPSISCMVRIYGRQSSGTCGCRKLAGLSRKRASASMARAPVYLVRAHMGPRPGAMSRASGARSLARP